MILLILSSLFIFFINLFWIELFSEKINSFIIILFSLVWVYYYIKLMKNIKNIFISFFLIIFLSLIIGFFINEIPSYSLWWISFIIWAILSSLIYIFLFRKDFLESKIKIPKFILSFLLIIFFTYSLLFVSPLWKWFFAYKDELLYTKCITNMCIDLYKINDTFFFWDNYIQLYKYRKDKAYMKFKKEIIDINSSEFNFLYLDKINKLEYLLNWKKEEIIIN